MRKEDRISAEKSLLRRRRGGPPTGNYGNKNSQSHGVTSAIRALQQKGKLHGRKHVAALMFINKWTRIVVGSLGYPALDNVPILDQKDIADAAFLRWKIETQQAWALSKGDPTINSEEIRADIRLYRELSSALRRAHNDAIDVTPGESLRRQYPRHQNVSIIPKLPEGAQADSGEGGTDMDP